MPGGRQDRRYHQDRELARSADAARNVEVSGPIGHTFGSQGAQSFLRPLTALRLFEITQAWTQETRAKPWPTGSWYAIGKPVVFFPDNQSSSGDWLVGVDTPEFAIWCPENVQPQSDVGDMVWAAHNPQSGFWELLSGIGVVSYTRRWGKLDGDLIGTSGQTVSLWQGSADGNPELWEVDSGEDVMAQAPPYLPSGATVVSDGTLWCRVENTGSQWVVIWWEPIVKELQVTYSIDPPAFKREALSGIGLLFVGSSGDDTVHTGIICSSSSGS